MINLPPRPEDGLSLWKGTALLAFVWCVGVMLCAALPGGL